MSNALIIFVKYPEPGKVKTRLTPDLSPGEAAAFHRAIAADIIAAHSDNPDFDTIVFFSPPDRKKDLAGWLGPGKRFEAQEGADLGEREQNAFTRVLGAGEGFGYDRAVLIGTDCPSLDNEKTERAFALLDAHDIVLGPAEDGGYYLLGLSTPRPELFSGIDWGTPEVLENTIQAAKKAQLDITMLDELYDVDTIDDLRRFEVDLKAGQIPNPLPETARFINEIF
jgi:rSAM/selenodomain-associated transferase 1